MAGDWRQKLSSVREAAESAVRDEIAQDRATYRNVKERGILKGLGMERDDRPFDAPVYPVPDHPRTTTAQMRARLATRKRAKPSR